MKKYILLLVISTITINTATGFGDFYEFRNPNNRIYDQNFNTNNYIRNKFNQRWSNPYDYSNSSPISKLFRAKKVAKDSINSLSNTNDYEYLLSKMEKKKFGTTYSDTDIESRLERLESDIFGASQSGDYIIRLNKLKRAFSANSLSHTNLRPFFSAGQPTSIPADSGYYSSLDSGFSSW